MIEIQKPDAALTKWLPRTRPGAGIRYVPSQFSFPFAHRNRQYVFHVLTKQCIKGTLPLSAEAGEGFDDLIAAQFLVPSDRDECAYYNSISSILRTYGKKKGWGQYTILPTSGCNARCVYCFEAGAKTETMSPETVEQTIRYICETRVEGRIKLHWFGGEPLLGEKIIDRICAALRENGIEFVSSMITNGSLITPAVTAKMKNDWNLNEIQVSMDGAEEDYISRKRYTKDQDYYHAVMEAVSRMSEAGISVAIRCNVDAENWNGVPRLLADLSEGIANKDRVSLYFSPLYEVRAGEGDLALWEKIREAREKIAEAGFRPASFLGSSMRFRVFHCMADSSSVVISPDGGLHACDEFPPGSRFGDIWHGVTDEQARQAFCRADQTREKCRGCTFLPDCTSFASCPRTDYHCRQLREMKTLDVLKRMIDKKEAENADEGDPIC